MKEDVAEILLIIAVVALVITLLITKETQTPPPIILNKTTDTLYIQDTVTVKDTVYIKKFIPVIEDSVAILDTAGIVNNDTLVIDLTVEYNLRENLFQNVGLNYLLSIPVDTVIIENKIEKIITVEKSNSPWFYAQLLVIGAACGIILVETL